MSYVAIIIAVIALVLCAWTWWLIHKLGQPSSGRHTKDDDAFGSLRRAFKSFNDPDRGVKIGWRE